jgi:hypothetical protein
LYAFCNFQTAQRKQPPKMKKNLNGLNLVTQSQLNLGAKSSQMQIEVAVEEVAAFFKKKLLSSS